jgi:signal transduction histidine kinase
MEQHDTGFARLVSLACHDLRTPLATIHGFARTVPKVAPLNAQAERFLDLIASASRQMEELIAELSAAARVETGRLAAEPEAVDTLELARQAAAELDATAGTVTVEGAGGQVAVSRARAGHALASLAGAVLRHSGRDALSLRATGEGVAISPVAASLEAVFSGPEPRDLGAAVALRILPALGATWNFAGDELVVRFAKDRSGV